MGAGAYEGFYLGGGQNLRAKARKKIFGVPPLATVCSPLKNPFLKKYWFLSLFFFNPPLPELRGGNRTTAPWYATVPGLRKGNASRCNIKRASLMGAPSQPLRGASVEGGGGGAAPPSYAPGWECMSVRLDSPSVFMVFRSHVSNLIINIHKFRFYFLFKF